MRDCDVNVLRRVGTHARAPFRGGFHWLLSVSIGFPDQPALSLARQISQMFSMSF
jgi:hypothetical protein